MSLLEAVYCPLTDINTDGQIYHKDFLVAERAVCAGSLTSLNVSMFPYQLVAN